MPGEKNWTFWVTLCSFLVGILLMFQLRAQGQTQVTSADNILPKLIEANQENAQVKAQNDHLNSELQELKQGANAAMLANKELARARMQAGFEAVHGQGIRITLDDSKQSISNAAEAPYYVIHEQYLQQIVNALWNTKADAVAINGQRVMENTEIFCQGNYISINGTVQTPPYIITAIGDPQKLLQGVKFYLDSTLEFYSKTYGIIVQEEPVSDVEIPAGTIPSIKYATPVKGGN